MQSLSTYLNENVEPMFESHMQKKEWEHRGDYKYAYAVIGMLINGKPVAIGDKTATGSYEATPEEIEVLKSFDPTEHTMEDFNDIFHGKLKWQDIFKGSFSGYERGLASGNQGNAFEDEFCRDFESKYREDMEKALGLKSGELMGYKATPRGGENQRRPLTMDGKNIVLSIPNGNKNIGETVVDVEVAPLYELTNNGKDDSIMLSLKYGPKVTFCNAGITHLFPKTAFSKFEKDGEFVPQNVGQIKGQAMLDMFGLDPIKFAETFTKYRQKKDYDTDVDITNKIDKDMIFAFLESVVGYGYVLVHKLDSKTHYVDLREKCDMNRLLGHSIKKAVVHYGGKKGTSKYVSIDMELDHMILQFDFRDKQGEAFPRSLMANYTIKY